MRNDDLAEVLLSLAGVVDGDEPVHELAHALLAGHHALESGADPGLVVAALFHDVAHSPLVGPMYPGVPHEVAGEEWLRERFGERVGWLAGSHVAAKLYLLETEPGYRDRLTGESSSSADLQAENLEQAFDRRDHAWWPDAVRLRRWDDLAKDPSAHLPNPLELLGVARSMALP
jgi:predicted HD phosphohydrolase